MRRKINVLLVVGLFLLSAIIVLNTEGKETGKTVSRENDAIENSKVLGPLLSYNPRSYDFGDKVLGVTDSTIFYIWNGGGCSCGTLYYTINESCSWLDVTPTIGTSTGEFDLITISINTNSLSKGYHDCILSIDSNAGSGAFIVKINIVAKVVNIPPNKPSINGPSSGKAGLEYDYEFVTIDPDGDDVYYFISWGCCGDGDFHTYGPYESGVAVKLSHSWSEQGNYIIQAYAKDINEVESETAIFEISMPKSKTYTNPLFLRILERFPISQKLLLLIK